MEASTEWTFFAECAIPKDVNELLIEGEVAETAFKTVRDCAIFTNKRLIVRDSQGITGKKAEIYSLSWKSVNMWSTENSGHLDLSAEIELWTRAGYIKINLRKGADVRKIDHLIAQSVL